MVVFLSGAGSDKSIGGASNNNSSRTRRGFLGRVKRRRTRSTKGGGEEAALTHPHTNAHARVVTTALYGDYSNSIAKDHLAKWTDAYSPNLAGVGTNRAQEEIIRALKILLSRQEREDAEKKRLNEWRVIAIAVDRILFWIFFIVTTVSSVVFLVILPLVKRDDLEKQKGLLGFVQDVQGRTGSIIRGSEATLAQDMTSAKPYTLI
ncbi:putative ligand-gated ion channel subunit-like, partial [Homarus americanus]